MPSKSGEFAWNSVDVRGDDGLLHNGRVIDALDEGLIVHFGESGHFVPQLMPFGQVFHSLRSDYLPRSGHRIDEGLARADARAVEVLLRAQPGDPWKWYPAVLLDSFGLVRVTLPEHGQLEGIVVHHRIRVRTSERRLAGRCVEKGRFATQRLTLPVTSQQERAVSDSQIIATVNAHCLCQRYWMMATHVHHGAGAAKELGILQLVDGYEFAQQYAYVRYTASEHLVHGRVRKPVYFPADTLAANEDALVSMLAPVFVTRSLSSTGTSTTPYPDAGIQSLLRNRCSLLPQILECLTTLEQSKLRGVCQQWDTVLTSPYIRRVLSVSQPPYTADHAVEVYRFAACLYKCWTPQTHVLVLYGGRAPDTSDTRLEGPARLLQRIRDDKGLPAVPVVLLSGNWGFGVHYSDSVGAAWRVCAALAGTSQQVIFKDAALQINLTSSYQSDQDFITLRFATQRLRITQHMTASDFWAVLNKELPDLSAQDLHLLEEWITVPPMTYPWQITQVLNTTQTLDPRDGVCYRGMRFSPYLERYKGYVVGLDGVHMHVRHLTKLTLHALLQRFQVYNQSSHALLARCD